MNPFIYFLSRLIGRILSPLFLNFRRIGFRHSTQGPYLLVCNHISHFDPPLLAVAMKQPIEFMTMIELFQNRFFAAWLRAVGAFPVKRGARDLRAVRTTIRRLRAGKIVVVFPEGGIRLGAESILGGAPMPRSSAALAHLGRCPVRTCLILGSDQLYNWRSLFRRPRIYLIYGEELRLDPGLSRLEARQLLTQQIETSFHRLYQKLLSEGKITQDLQPRSAQEHWATS